eukprot:COSAG05_NODE_32_length_28165_cov_450.666714_29_plen_53_part_00
MNVHCKRNVPIIIHLSRRHEACFILGQPLSHHIIGALAIRMCCTFRSINSDP